MANNIIIRTNTGSTTTIWDCDGTFVNNIITADYQPDYNITGITSTDQVFTGDYESYTLIEDSPAKNAGTDGTDIGIFGGLYPYVAGGQPLNHPYYTKAAIGSKAKDDKVNVTLNIQLQDE